MTSHLRRRRLGLPGLTRVEWVLVVLVVVVVGTLVHPYRAQQASRYALTAAVVERGTVVLDDYEHVLGIDRAMRDGHTYSDKAPGQPFIAVPFYAAGRAFGVEEATILRIEENLGLWWVTFWSAGVAGAVLLVLTYQRARRESPRLALPVAIALFFGTMLLPFSALLFGHVLSAVFLYGSFLLIHEKASKRRLVIAGLLAGLGVVVEYTSILGVLVVVAFAWWRYRSRVWPLAMGGVVPATLLAWYNTVAFGSPFTLSYQFTAFSGTTDEARPVLDMFGSASLENLVRLMFEGRGLLIATPVVLVALAGAVWRLTRGRQVDAVVALVMFSVFLVLPIFWGNPWGGDSPGPRYMVPALPFLAVPLAWAWQRWRLVTLAAVALSVLTMVAATFTDPLISRFATDGLGVWLGMASRGETVDTLFTMLAGGWGWILHFLLVVAVAVVLVRVSAGGPTGAIQRSVDDGADRAAMEM